MDARRRRGIKKASLRQERQTAEDIGGRTQANSGATRMGGGADVRGSGMRVECKFTEKDQYTLKFSELEKLRKQATKTLEFPVFQFAFKFRNTMEKYAVIRYQAEDLAQFVRYVRKIEYASVTFHRDVLRQQLLEGPFLLQLEDKTFRIYPWDDFMKMFQDTQGVSMGCFVPNAGCSICGSKPCEHVKES